MTGNGLAPAWIDGILALVGCEAVAVALWLRRRDAAAWIAPALLTLAAGAALLVAVRFASTESAPLPVAVPLALGGIAHAASFGLVFRRGLIGPPGS